MTCNSAYGWYNTTSTFNTGISTTWAYVGIWLKVLSERDSGCDLKDVKVPQKSAASNSQ